jgi:hypothetical protein
LIAPFRTRKKAGHVFRDVAINLREEKKTIVGTTYFFVGRFT